MTFKWSEIKQYGGVNEHLLSAMHKRTSHKTDRKLGHNTWSRLERCMGDMWKNVEDIPLRKNDACDCYDLVFDTNEAYDEWLKQPPCVECSLFRITLHGNEIAQVWRHHVSLNVRTIRHWNTPTTADRVNTILSGTGWSLGSRSGKPHLWNYGREETFRLANHYSNDYVHIDRHTGASFSLYARHECVRAPMEHPNIPNNPAIRRGFETQQTYVWDDREDRR